MKEGAQRLRPFHQTQALALERRRVGCFGSGLSRIGTRGECLRFWFTAIEPAHDISADGPRRNLRGLRLLAFAVRLFVGRADEAALDEDVSFLMLVRTASASRGRKIAT